MIRIMAYTADGQTTTSLTLTEAIQQTDAYRWIWVDFNKPTIEETTQLQQFGFHPLAIEDCLQFTHRPKLDYYDGYNFFIYHALHTKRLKPEELDVFVSATQIVTFHFQQRDEVDELWNRLLDEPNLGKQGTNYIHYKLTDKLVDQYFPAVSNIEDRIKHTERYLSQTTSYNRHQLKEIYYLRNNLHELRHTVLPMQDLLYRILNSQRLNHSTEEKRYYSDIYDHLCKLSTMIDSHRAFTSEIQDHYMSLNAYRMNTVMMTLTVITTIFMPLTFIAGLYGMNFKHMPELELRYGYFLILGIMAFVGFVLFMWFKQKGWFDMK